MSDDRDGWGGHIFHKCKQPCPDVGQCNYCDGGLALCIICGAMEGALLEECPGTWLTPEQHDWNYKANLRKWRKGA